MYGETIPAKVLEDSRRDQKSVLRYMAAFFLFLLVFALLTSFFWSAFFFVQNRLSLRAGESTAETNAGTDTKQQTIVILDAGHGGEDGGTSSADGTLEKDLNLRLVQILADYLRTGGIEVVLTRDTDRLLYDPSSDHEGKKKILDFAVRLNVAKQLEAEHPDAKIYFISIHMNFYPQESVSGLQVWHSSREADSLPLALNVQNMVKELLQPENNRKVKAAGSNIYLLDRLTVPAILIECGFLSNPEESARLTDEAYQKKLAFAIFTAVMRTTGETSESGITDSGAQ